MYPESKAFKSTRPSGSGDLAQPSKGHSDSGFALVFGPEQLELGRRLIFIDEFAFACTGQLQAEAHRGVRQRTRRMCAAVAYLKGQSLAVEPRVEERFRLARRGGERLPLFAPVEIEQDRTRESPAFVRDGESDKRQPVGQRSPDANNGCIFRRGFLGGRGSLRGGCCGETLSDTAEDRF